MILVDFSQLCYRILHISLMMNKQNIKKNEQIKISKFKGTFFHLLFSNIRYSKKEFSSKYGETVIAIDSRGNWRKDVYPKYKTNRKKDREESEIDFDDFFKIMNEAKDVISIAFPFKVIEVNKAEADDVIAVLAKKYKEDNIIISTDKDYKQLLANKHIKLFNPIDKKFIELDENELDSWIIEHCVKGDESDNVPRIIDETEFTDEFIKHLKDNDIYEYEVHKVQELELGKYLIKQYEDQDKNPYKKQRFMYVQFMKDFENNLNKNPLYKKNLERNKILVLAENIPENIQNNIIEQFENTYFNYDPIKMLEFFSENSLFQLSNNIQDFYMTGGKINNNIFCEWE